MIRLVSPTGQSPRVGDAYGSGAFGAGRGGRLHLGCDYLCEPGQLVYAPCAGKFRRISAPYAGGPLSGLVVETPWGWWRLFYVRVDPRLPGEVIDQGQRIGVAQDCTVDGPRPYPGMQPHVHCELWLRVGAGGPVIAHGHPPPPVEVAVDPELFRVR